MTTLPLSLPMFENLSGLRSRTVAPSAPQLRCAAAPAPQLRTPPPPLPRAAARGADAVGLSAAQARTASPLLPRASVQGVDTIRPSAASRPEAVKPQRASRPSWLDRLCFFATDAIDAGRIFSAVGAAGWMGQVAQLSSVVWGPVFAGIGLAAGGVQMAASAFAKDPATRRDRLIGGGLEMLASGAALVSTLGLAPAHGAVATLGFVGVKLMYDMLTRPAAPRLAPLPPSSPPKP